jgi:hypothetical protein
MLEKDPQLAQEVKDDPAGALAKYAYTSDPKFYRMAIAGLIGIIVLVIVGAIAIELLSDSDSDKALPDWIAALATTALGGLVGLFAPSPSEK